MSFRKNKNRITCYLILVCFMSVAPGSVAGQQISNRTVIPIDLELPLKYLSLNHAAYEASAQYNYLGLEYGHLPLTANGELIAPGGRIFLDSKGNYYYVLQLDDENEVQGYTNLYIKGFEEGWGNWNVAATGSNVGTTTKNDLVYIYGSVSRTDSLFVKDEFVRSIPGNAAFVLTFNENLELTDDFFYGLDTLAAHGDVHLKVDDDGDYHIAGKFFNSSANNFQLEIGGALIDPIRDGYNTQTFYCAIVDHVTKLAKTSHSFGGINSSMTKLLDFELHDNQDALILFEQSDELELNGEWLSNEVFPGDITLLCLNGDSLRYHVNYEGPALQTGHLLKKLRNNHTCEYIRTEGGEAPFVINGESILYDSTLNNLIINRNPAGEVAWVQNIQGPGGGGNDIFDITLSDDQTKIWVSGRLRQAEPFLIDGQTLIVNDQFGGFLMALNAETGAFIEVLYPRMDADPGIQPYTDIRQIDGIDDGSLKVITQIGFRENVLSPTYDYTIGDLTIPVAGRGELLIYDLKLDTGVSAQEVSVQKNRAYPNPVSPGQSIYFSDDSNNAYMLFSLAGKNLGSLKNEDTFPFVSPGLYLLKGNRDGRVFKVLVVDL